MHELCISTVRSEVLRLSSNEWSVLKDLEIILQVSTKKSYCRDVTYYRTTFSAPPGPDDHGKGSHTSPLWGHTVPRTLYELVGIACIEASQPCTLHQRRP